MDSSGTACALCGAWAERVTDDPPPGLHGCRVCGALTCESRGKAPVGPDASELDLQVSRAMVDAEEIRAALGRPDESGTVAVLGAGRGVLLHALARLRYEVVGCEADAGLRAQAERHCQLTPEVLSAGDPETFLARAASKGSTFGAVVVGEDLVGNNHPAEVLSRAADRLRSGGMLAVMLPLPVEGAGTCRWFGSPAVGGWIGRTLGLVPVATGIGADGCCVRFLLRKGPVAGALRTEPRIEALAAADWSTPAPLAELRRVLRPQAPPVAPTGEKRLVLHIGFHKTGTSALQETLYANREALAAAGLRYPVPLAPFPSHLDIPAALIPEDIPWYRRPHDPAELLARYRRILDDAPGGTAMVLSSEELCRADSRPCIPDAIAKAFAGVDVRVVAYVRDPVDFCVSLYNHLLREGTTQTFEEYLAGRNYLAQADFHARLEPWRRRFGAGRVIVRDYDALEGGNIVADFLACLDMPGVGLPTTGPQSNAGAHPWLAEAFRQVNAAGAAPAETRRMRDALLAAGRALPRANAAEHYLGEVGARALRARFAKLTPALPHRLRA